MEGRENGTYIRPGMHYTGVNLGNCFRGREWGWQFVSLNLAYLKLAIVFHRVLAVFNGVSPSHRYVVMCREIASEASNGVLMIRLSQDLVFRDFVYRIHSIRCRGY